MSCVTHVQAVSRVIRDNFGLTFREEVQSCLSKKKAGLRFPFLTKPSSAEDASRRFVGLPGPTGATPPFTPT